MIARYEYDGLNRRVKKHPGADTDDDFDAWRHVYFNSSWQALEARLSEGEATAPDTLQPEYQFVWSLRSIDAPILDDAGPGGGPLRPPVRKALGPPWG